MSRRYAIVIDFDVDALRAELGDNYSRAYVEVADVLASLGFDRRLGNLFVGNSTVNAIGTVLAAMEVSKRLPWFSECARDVSMMRIEESSDLNPAVQSVREIACV